MSTPHCTDAQLNDWLDGRLAPDERARVAAHGAACAACRARADALGRVVAAARGLPPEIMPPNADVLERAIAARLGAAARPAGDAPRLAPRPAAPAWARRLGVGRRPLAAALAAAVVLVAGTAVVTARVVRGRAAAEVAAARAPNTPRTPGALDAPDAPDSPDSPGPFGAPAAGGVPARQAALRAEGDATLAALRAAAASGDRVLAAETLRVLDRALATVDSAIAEAEAALARDPGNRALGALVARTYAQRRALVRSGAALGSRS